MRSKNVIRQEKIIIDDSDDDPTFSAEDTDQDSSDNRKPDIKKINDSIHVLEVIVVFLFLQI